MNFLKNKWIMLSIISILLIVIIIVSSNPASPINFIYKAVSVPLAPVQSFFSGAAKRFSAGVNAFINYNSAPDEYTEYINNIEELEETIRKLRHYEGENRDLRELLAIGESNIDYNYIAAEVIAFDTDDWYNIFSINKGSMAGIKLFDCVITNKGLVGKVISVAPMSAKVMSIVTVDSSLMGRISRTNDVVRIRGVQSFTSDIFCKVDRIGETVDISVGDIIETTESGGIYPKGIVVGKVKEILTENNVRYAIIEPVVDFRRIDIVMVMSRNE